MKEYKKPEIEIIELNSEDVIATSTTGPSEQCTLEDILNGICE